MRMQPACATAGGPWPVKAASAPATASTWQHPSAHSTPCCPAGEVSSPRPPFRVVLYLATSSKLSTRSGTSAQHAAWHGSGGAASFCFTGQGSPRANNDNKHDASRLSCPCMASIWGARRPVQHERNLAASGLLDPQSIHHHARTSCCSTPTRPSCSSSSWHCVRLCVSTCARARVVSARAPRRHARLHEPPPTA